VVQYESKENAGHRFWTARYGRYAIRIETNRPGTYRWLSTHKGRTVRNGVAPTLRRQLPRCAMPRRAAPLEADTASAGPMQTASLAA
jgi:hypothetical protein